MKVVENGLIVLSIVFLAFTVLDYYNAQMDFAGNMMSSRLLIAYCVLSIFNSAVILGKGKKRRVRK